MRRVIGIVGCVVVLGLTQARADGDTKDEVLKRYFPERDLSKALLKIVDETNGFYGVGDSLEVTKDGSVRTTNAAIVQRVTGPNEAAAKFTSYEAPRAVLTFVKPVRMPSDIAGNKLWVFTVQK